MEKLIEPEKIVQISGVPSEIIGVGNGGDQPVRDATSTRPASGGDGRYHLTATVRGSCIKGRRLEGCLNSLNSRLTTGTFRTRGSEVGTGGQFSQSNGTHFELVW